MFWGNNRIGMVLLMQFFNKRLVTIEKKAKHCPVNFK